VVGNTDPGKLAGKCHRKETAQAAGWLGADRHRAGLADARARQATAAGKGERVR